MKKIQFKKKLRINKEIITQLTDSNMDFYKGGKEPRRTYEYYTCTGDFSVGPQCKEEEAKPFTSIRSCDTI